MTFFNSAFAEETKEVTMTTQYCISQREYERYDEKCPIQASHICLNLVYDACQKRTQDTSLRGMSVCLYEETKEWDKILNVSYKELMDLYTPEQKEFLQDTQKLWLKWRDKNCAYPRVVSSLIEESGRENMIATCMRDITYERVMTLRHYLDLWEDRD